MALWDDITKGATKVGEVADLISKTSGAITGATEEARKAAAADLIVKAEQQYGVGNWAEAAVLAGQAASVTPKDPYPYVLAAYGLVRKRDDLLDKEAKVILEKATAVADGNIGPYIDKILNKFPETKEWAKQKVLGEVGVSLGKGLIIATLGVLGAVAFVKWHKNRA